MMSLALQLASEGRNLPPPNPSVGCVIVSSSGVLLGQGATERAGGHHAEIVALQDAHARGNSVVGATVFVTLEPCSHTGRTGPCCDAIIGSGIKKVVASIADPNPLVAGRGFQRLKEAGIDVEIGQGAEQSKEINIGFFSRMIRKKPWVRLKVATSIDGKTALENGQSKWITSEDARKDGQKWRARACAILTGIGTIRADDPLLNVRIAGSTRQPTLIIVDSKLATPLDARLFEVDRNILIYTATSDTQKIKNLGNRGAQVIYLPEQKQDTNIKVDLIALSQDLVHHQINELHVEAGQHLNGALITAGLVDEYILYVAPKIIGNGRNFANFGPIDSLNSSIPLDFISMEKLGTDIRLIARKQGHGGF